MNWSSSVNFSGASVKSGPMFTAPNPSSLSAAFASQIFSVDRGHARIGDCRSSRTPLEHSRGIPGDVVRDVLADLLEHRRAHPDVSDPFQKSRPNLPSHPAVLPVGCRSNRAILE